MERLTYSDIGIGQSPVCGQGAILPRNYSADHNPLILGSVPFQVVFLRQVAQTFLSVPDFRRQKCLRRLNCNATLILSLSKGERVQFT